MSLVLALFSVFSVFDKPSAAAFADTLERELIGGESRAKNIRQQRIEALLQKASLREAELAELLDLYVLGTLDHRVRLVRRLSSKVRIRLAKEGARLIPLISRFDLDRFEDRDRIVNQLSNLVLHVDSSGAIEGHALDDWLVGVVREYGLSTARRELALARASESSELSAVLAEQFESSDFLARVEIALVLESAGAEGESARKWLAQLRQSNQVSIATATGSVPELLRLAESGVDLDARNGALWNDTGYEIRRGERPLITAIRNGNYACVRVLLERGADARGGGGACPLRVAMFSGRADIAALLAPYYPAKHVEQLTLDVRLIQESKYSSVAALAEVGELIKRGADVNATDELGCSALQYAVISKDQKLATLLIESGGRSRHVALQYSDSHETSAEAIASRLIRTYHERPLLERDRLVFAELFLALVLFDGGRLQLEDWDGEVLWTGDSAGVQIREYGYSERIRGVIAETRISVAGLSFGRVATRVGDLRPSSRIFVVSDHGGRFEFYRFAAGACLIEPSGVSFR